MKRKNKNAIFLLFVAIFTIATPLVIFYSLGWRIDWVQKKFVQPGVFYFKVLPRSAEIFLNGKPKKKTDFFFGSALIDNLSQKLYSVEIKKDGFKMWKKNLQIQNGQVTEAKNIILIPENNKFANISEKVENFFPSQDGSKLVAQKKTNDGWTLEMANLATNEQSSILKSSDILALKNTPLSSLKSKPVLELKDLIYSFDNKKIIIVISVSRKDYYYILDLEKSPVFLSYENMPNSGIETINFHPKNSQLLLYLKSGLVYQKDISKSDSGTAFEEKVSFLDVSDKSIFYLDNLGFLYKISLSFSQKEKINTIALKLNKGEAYEIFYSNSYLFLRAGKNLYKFNVEKEAFELAQESINDAVFNSSYKKLAIFEDKNLSVLFLEKLLEQPEKQEGEKSVLTGNFSNLLQLFWITDHYLLFLDNDTIKVSETDDRDKINTYEIGKFKNPKIYWNNVYKKLYVLSEKNLYSLDNLTP